MVKAGQTALESRLEPLLRQHKQQFHSSYQQIEKAIVSDDVTLIGITNQLVYSISQDLGQIQLRSDAICEEIENAMNVLLKKPVVAWKAQTLNEIVTGSIAVADQRRWLEQQVQSVENEMERIQQLDDQLKEKSRSLKDSETSLHDREAKVNSQAEKLEGAKARHDLREQSHDLRKLEQDRYKISNEQRKNELDQQKTILDELKSANEHANEQVQTAIRSQKNDLARREEELSRSKSSLDERELRLRTQENELKGCLHSQEADRVRELRLQSQEDDLNARLQSSRVRSSIQDVEAERIRNERDKISRELQSSLVVRESNVREREEDVKEHEEAVADLENNLKTANTDLENKLKNALVRENELKDTIKEQTSCIQSPSSDQSSHRPRYSPDNLVMDEENFKLAHRRVWGEEPSEKLLRAIKKMEKHVPATSDFSDQPIPLQDKIAELLLLEENIYLSKLKSQCRKVDLMLVKRRFKRPTGLPGFNGDSSQLPSFGKGNVLSLLRLKNLKEFEETLLGKASFGMNSKFVVRFVDSDHVKAMAELDHFNNTNYLDAFRSIQNKHNFMPQFSATNSQVKGSTTLALTERVEDSDGNLWGHEIVSYLFVPNPNPNPSVVYQRHRISNTKSPLLGQHLGWT